ncbi:Y-family DNA polymerase [Emcibacter sp.]|uniref:Y-family DNA polymerase n=1 Tax=Emcibacter sp. TaxID=1979954 RepID=UPI002AA9064D|nr:Y-family DNA polymerase [Emcibacter sp.]
MRSIPSTKGGTLAGGYVALVDVNNFYVSCERLFRPDLQTRPMVVLSNNDGCIISRSEEAKEMGVGMGAAFHEVRGLLEKNRVVVFSSNYPLYGDMSGRVISVLHDFTPFLEVYSIDESFLDMTGFNDLVAHGRRIRDRVLQWTGLPVCVGIGRTKTLAKIANRLAKQRLRENPESDGVMLIPDENDDILADLPVTKIWGISKGFGRQLAELGISTALDLKRANPKMVRSRMNVVAERIVHELNNIPCMALEMALPDRKQVMVSRSFSRRVYAHEEMKEAVSTYVTRGGEKLREQQLVASGLNVFIRTSPFDKENFYSSNHSICFPEAHCDTIRMIRAAFHCLARIYRPGYIYQKVGVQLFGLEKEGHIQRDLFLSGPEEEKSRMRNRALMAAIDSLNGTWGGNTVGFASSGIRRSWAMNQKLLSPRYTTRWSDIRRISAR